MSCPATEIILRHDGSELAHAALGPGAYVIGRSPDVEIYADTPLLSRRHARLTIAADHLIIEDLGSSNGTFVAGRRISDSTRLLTGQPVQLGDVSLEIRGGTSTVHPPALRAAAAGEEGATLVAPRGLPAEVLAPQRYAIGEAVARGGMGAILAAQQTALGRPVAMKVMLEGGAAAEDVARFVAEAQVTGRLEHPNIVPVHELAVDERGQPYYTMKMVRGITLKKVLDLLAQGVEATEKKYPLPARLTIFQKVCDAVAFAHAHGILHRDLKPENIMLGDYGEVLVMDWGLAKRIGGRRFGGAPSSSGSMGAGEAAPSSGDDPGAPAGGGVNDPGYNASRTMAGTIMGTPAYMSPEQARGEVENLDARSDVNALGAILFALLHLRPAFTGRVLVEIVDKVQRGEVEWSTGILSVRPAGVPPAAGKAGKMSVPPSLLAVCRKALAFEREQRYATVEELQTDLTAYQNGFATSAENAGAWKQFTLFVRRNRAVAVSIAAALVALAAVSTGFTLKVIGERNRATAERDRAERALADLQKAAPTLIAEARKLIDAQQFEEALAKITFAAEIEPGNASHRLLRAQLLQAMLRLDEAAADFRHVLTLAPDAAARDSAQANLALCERLQREHPDADTLDRPALQALYAQMEKESRSTQAAPLAVKLGHVTRAAEMLLRARWEGWKKLPGWSKKLESERIKWTGDGTLALDFSDVLIEDLSTLNGLPVTKLQLFNTRVADLRPLHGMKLRDLRIWRTGQPPPLDLAPLKGMPLTFFQCEAAIVDLAPLAGMKLKDLRLAGEKLKDFSAVRGMPLETVFLGNTGITQLNDFAGAPIRKFYAPLCRALTDISALRTMPLEGAELADCPALRDFRPLLDCRKLQWVKVPRYVREIEVLRAHPAQPQMGYYANTPSTKPAAQFWVEFDTTWKAKDDDRTIREKLRAAFAAAGQPPLEDGQITREKDGTYKLNLSPPRSRLTTIPDLSGLPVSAFDITDAPIKSFAPFAAVPVRQLVFYGAPAIDLAPLRQCAQLEHLHLSSNPGIRDLSALAGMKLHTLLVYSTSVSDLSPVAGMPLRRLVINKTKVTDLTPLKGSPTLESLEAEENPGLRDLTPLAGLRLQHLQISASGITDLAPLAGMPLRELRFSRATKKIDVRPLLACRELERLLLPENAEHVGELRALPKLQRLSTKWDNTLNLPAQSASEFWKEYDARHGGR